MTNTRTLGATRGLAACWMRRCASSTGANGQTVSASGLSPASASVSDASKPSKPRAPTTRRMKKGETSFDAAPRRGPRGSGGGRGGGGGRGNGGGRGGGGGRGQWQDGAGSSAPRPRRGPPGGREGSGWEDNRGSFNQRSVRPINVSGGRGPGQDRGQRGGGWPSKQASNPSFAAGGVQYAPRTRQEDRTREMLAMEGDMDDASPGSLSSGLQRRGKKSWNASNAAGKSRSSLIYGKKSQRPKSPTARHADFQSVDAMGRRKDKQKDHHRDKKPQERIHAIPDDVTVLKFSKLLGVPLSDVERVLVDIGEEPQSVEESLCPESAELVAMELGKTIEIVKGSGASMQDLASAKPRPAVITVMGHVDHGKTSLLDALRSTSVAAREAGGITQHVGAFEVLMPESKSSLTFLDTPGHAAFSAMRARGAAITDIVVLVVAADDGVMPQTKEAYAHAKASGCPIVVAITKCDLEGANVDKVKHEVADLGLEIEEYGGTVQVVELAAPKGIGLKELEQALLLEAELLEPKANVDVPAKGVVIESRVDKGQGPVAMVIVTAGELKRGDSIVVGSEWGKVRTLRDFTGQVVSKGGVLPGRPVEVAGLKGVPGAGDELVVVASDERAQKLSNARVFRFEQREQLQWEDTSSNGASTRASAKPTNAADAADAADETPAAIVIPVIIKADVHGSAEALKESLLALSNDAVKINIVHTGIGSITSSDVDLAVPFGCHIVGFNVKTAADAGLTAKSKDVRISNRRIIYEILQDVQDIIDGATPKPPEDVVIGNAQVLALFKVPGAKKSESIQVAGCRVVEGSLRAGLKVEVVRSGEVVHVGEIEGLRRHRLEVDSVGKNTECGLSIAGWAEYVVGDEVRCVEVK